MPRGKNDRGYRISQLVLASFAFGAVMIFWNINTLPIMLSIGGPAHFGAFTGYYYTATFTAAVVCPILIGWIVGISNYNMIHIFAAVMMIISIICLFRVKHGDTDHEAIDEAVKSAGKD